MQEIVTIDLHGVCLISSWVCHLPADCLKKFVRNVGFAITYEAVISAYADVGSWDIYAGVATDKVEEATKAILAELTKVRDDGVTDEELTIAKKRLVALLSFKSEDPEFFSEWYGRAELFGMPLLTIDDYIEKLQSITKSTLMDWPKVFEN